MKMSTLRMTFETIFKYLRLFMLNYTWAGATISALTIKKYLETDGEKVEGNEVKAFVLHMGNVFGGGILANLLSGHSPLNTINLTYMIISITAWLLIFYGPDKYFYNLENAPASKISLAILDELKRCFLVLEGVDLASDYIDCNSMGPLLVSCIAVIKAHGSNMLWDGFKISLTTKLCFITSVTFTLISELWPEYLTITFCVVSVVMVIIKFVLKYKGTQQAYETVANCAASTALSVMSCSLIYNHIINNIVTVLV